MTPLPTDLAQIAGITDNPVLRNLVITQRYHDLSRALAETMGNDRDVNWSTFATWASKTAGLSIRDEEVPPVVDEVADLRSALVAPIRATLRAVSRSISDGNRKVFAELAPLFVRFVQTFRGLPGTGAAEIDAFVAKLDARPSDEGGQAPLRQAFAAYNEARCTEDASLKARLMLLGNCLVGLHEQTRLQPQIALAMDAPIDELLGKERAGCLLALAPSLVRRPSAELVHLARDVWERVATRTMMSLALPGGATLPLGADIPPSAAARPYLPPALRDIGAPPALVEVLARFDRARGATDVGSASIDWRNLPDRMNFIVNLFRSRQQEWSLMDPPFNDAQRQAIEGGQVPSPSLGKL